MKQKNSPQQVIREGDARKNKTDSSTNLTWLRYQVIQQPPKLPVRMDGKVGIMTIRKRAEQSWANERKPLKRPRHHQTSEAAATIEVKAVAEEAEAVYGDEDEDGATHAGGLLAAKEREEALQMLRSHGSVKSAGGRGRMTSVSSITREKHRRPAIRTGIL